MTQYDIAIVGGAGHVGAPLAIIFASKGFKVLVLDKNKEAMQIIASGELPFIENNYKDYLHQSLKDNKLFFSNDPAQVKFAKNIIITIGTNVDEFHNPRINDIVNCIDNLPINNDHLLILRSTIYPGTTEYLGQHLSDKNLFPSISFCPERLVQGNGIHEIQNLPQIVSGITKDAEDRAANLFEKITSSIVRMQPKEAELAKLFANTYRYIQFAAANKFYEIAAEAGLDYKKILAGAKQDYPRLRDLPGAGFCGGSCLFKDTLQLCSFMNGKFVLGETAVRVNEGFPAVIVNQLEKKYDLKTKTVGLIGMAFKADSDDTRTSLSYKLKKILKFKAKNVLTTDYLVSKNIDPDLLPFEDVIRDSDILIICAPHKKYKEYEFPKDKEIVNVW